MTKFPFTPVAAIRTARGYHSTSSLLFSICENRLREFENIIPTPDQQAENINLLISAIMLESLAVEIALKTKIHLVTGNFERGHNLLELFEKLPQIERDIIENIYCMNNLPYIRNNIIKCLEYYSEAFIKWRYHYEQSLDGGLFELQYAFLAISNGI